MLKIISIAAASAGMLLVSGCASPDALKVKPQATQVLSPRIGEDLVKAFCQNDADLFLAQLPDNFQFGKRDFELTYKGMTEKLGTPVSYTYLSNLEHPFSTISVWKIKFTRKNTEKNQIFTQETLFRAAYTVYKGKPLLLSMNFL